MSVTATTAMYIALAGTAVATAGAAYESHEQGIQTSNQAKQKARVEADNATAKAIQSRQNMLRALASQNASSLGSVATGQGTSFGANTGRQIREGQMDLAVINANESADVSLLDQQGANARSAGNVGAVTDVFGGASKAAGIYGDG